MIRVHVAQAKNIRSAVVEMHSMDMGSALKQIYVYKKQAGYIFMVRELTEAEKTAYEEMIDGAKQLTIFGTEEELDPRDYVFEYPDRERESF